MEGKNTDKKTRYKEIKIIIWTLISNKHTSYLKHRGKKKRLEVLYHVPGKTDRLHEKIYPQEGVEIKRWIKKSYGHSRRRK